MPIRVPRVRKRVLLTLLLLVATALAIFYYALEHSSLSEEPRLSAQDFHGFHPVPAAAAAGAEEGAAGAADDADFESVKRQLEQLEHQGQIDRLAKDAAALATAPTPTRRQARIGHSFGPGEFVSVAAVDVPPDETPGPLTVEAAEEAFERAASDVTASCKPRGRFGPEGDGGWYACLAGPYRPTSGACLSLSFGVGGIWSYDDQVAERLGCRALAFDPSLTRLTNHTRPGSGVQFYLLGLHSGPGHLPGTSWRVDSLHRLLDSLGGGGSDSVADLLKIDIEGSEWPALESALADGTLQRRVKQLMLELHSRESRPVPNQDTSVEQYRRYLRILDSLGRAGFRMWLSEPNAAGWFYSRAGNRRKRTCCYNCYFINTRFLPRVNAGRAVLEDQLLHDIHSVRVRPLRLPDVSAHRASPGAAEALYYSLVTSQDADCPDWRRVGPHGDSGYDVCASPPYALSSPAAVSAPNSTTGCLVYSFGIGDQYGFEDELAGDYGCAVHMFDPSLTQLGEHKRGPRQWFHLVGLGSVDQRRRNNGWQVNCLQTLMRRFHHEAATVDILKIDIELDEWDALDTAIGDGSLARVKQLILETHTKELHDVRTQPPDYLRFVRTWLGLYRLGFRQWRSRENARTHFISATGHNRPCCHEHSLININFM